MQKFNILVGVIPVFDSQILITQRSLAERFMPGAWGLPCGKINFGEDLFKAAIRELAEETGLSGSILRTVGVSSFMSRKGDDDLHNVQVNFLVQLFSKGPVILDKSSQDFRWINMDDYLTQGLDEFTTTTISQAFG